MDWGKAAKELAKPFSHDEVEFRIARSGTKKDGNIWATCFVYITNRAIMNRLDKVFGINGWKNEFREWHDTSQLCTISVWDSDKKEWIGKTDGADDTRFEATKGGLSDSMKRAGSHWGIGRYLYSSEEMFVETSFNKKENSKYQPAVKDKNGNIKVSAFYWIPPTMKYWEDNKENIESDPQEELTQKPPRPNFTAQANECKTMEELKKWFKSLSKEDQAKAVKVKDNRKEELATNQEPDVLQLEGLINDIKNESEAKTILELIGTNRTKINNYAEIVKLYNEKINELELGEELTMLPF